MKRNKVSKSFAGLGALALFMAVVLSSCKAGQDCPAYAKHKAEVKKEVKV